MAEWHTFLSAYDIVFEGRKAEKGLVLASILADFPVADALPSAQENGSVTPGDFILSCQTSSITPSHTQDRLQQRWEAFSNSSSNQFGSGLGCLLVAPDGNKIERSVKLEFRASNNEAEYEVAVYTLRLLLTMGITQADL